MAPSSFVTKLVIYTRIELDITREALTSNQVLIKNAKSIYNKTFLEFLLYVKGCYDVIIILIQNCYLLFSAEG